MSPRRWFPILLIAATSVVVAFLALPVLAIFLHTSPARLWDSLGESGSLDALKLSLETTAAAIAIIVVFGTPAAYLLATRSFRGKSLIVTLVELPLVLPPVVAGIGLLAAFGPHGLLGGTLMFAGSVQGVTQTVPLAIYGSFATDFPSALALSAILVIVSGSLLISIQLMSGSRALAVVAR